MTDDYARIGSEFFQRGGAQHLPTKTASYGYDGAGSRASRLSEGVSTGYAWDAEGRLAGVDGEEYAARGSITASRSAVMAGDCLACAGAARRASVDSLL